MAGRIFCSVMLLLSVAASAGDQPQESPRREAGEATDHDKSSVTSRRRMLYHLAEGSEIFPLDWLMALKSVRTGKPFLEDPERFGLIQDPEGLEVPGYGRVKLPIGLTIGVPRDVLAAAATLRPSTAADPLLAMNMVGVNCAACHVGRLRYNGNDLPIIEGAPNTFNIDAFYQELFQSAAETVLKRDKLETFLSDLGRLPAKSEISRILVSSFVQIKKNPSQASSTLEKAIFKRIGELFEDAECGGKLEAPNAKKFISFMSGRNLDPKAGDELRNLILPFKRDLFEASASASQEKLLQTLQQEGAVLPKVVELLRTELKSKDEGDLLVRFLKAYGLMYSRLDFLRTLKSLHRGGEQVTSPGPGRIDAFGNARRLVFKDAPKIPLNSPVSFPHLWGVGQLEWFHWDGNTNSFMERNIGQAMGLGAIADLETGASTISPSNIHTLETFFSQLAPPKWPEEQFGAVDTASERYRRGATLYLQYCSKCHDRHEGGQKSPDGSITYGLKQIGTDPLRATNFATPLEGDDALHSGVAGGGGKGQESCRTRRRTQANTGACSTFPKSRSAGLRLWATSPGRSKGSGPPLRICTMDRCPRSTTCSSQRTNGRSASLWGTASTTPSSWATSLSSPRCPRRNTRVSSCMTRGLPETAIEAIATVLNLVRLIGQHSSST